jgi:hypothetical protein
MVETPFGMLQNSKVSEQLHFTGRVLILGREALVYLKHVMLQYLIVPGSRTVIEWLKLPEKERPHLITLYFNEPDHTGHTLDLYLMKIGYSS